MFSILYSAGNKIKETFQGYGYSDRDYEVEKFKAKYLPGLELQLASDVLQKYNNYKSVSTHSHEIGIMYNLKYGGLGARVLCKPSPMTQLTANLRRLGDVYGISSMAVLDFQRYKLMRWDVGVNFFAGNMSYQINLRNTDKLVLSTRYEIWPTLVLLSEANIVFKDSSFMSNASNFSLIYTMFFLLMTVYTFTNRLPEQIHTMLEFEVGPLESPRMPGSFST